MITMMKMVAISTSLVSSSFKNPLKMSILLLLYSASLFYLMALDKSNIWMPSIFLMLFMGGILIMFMVLSSVTPNQKSGKLSWSVYTIILAAALSNYSEIKNSELLSSSLKSGLSSLNSTTLSTLLILMYFFCFLAVISSLGSALRSSAMC